MDGEKKRLELLQRFETLPAAQKLQIAERRQKALSGEAQVWYCTRGRVCDGRPHEGANYEHARGDQWPPRGHEWLYWAIMAGRGAGKTATGSNWARLVSRRVERIAAIARTGPDFRRTIIEGDSGLIAMCERAGETYDWKPALKEFTFQNGSKVYGYSGEEPDTLRGPQFGAAWIDEGSHIDLIQDVWDNLLYGLRLPGMPGGAKVLITTTPLPNKWTKMIVADENTVLSRVSTMANIHNLDEGYRKRVIDPKIGTRQGRQELEGMILEDVDGALWTAGMLVRARYTRDDFVRVLVGIDPAGSQGKRSDLTGIIVVGITAEGVLVVLSDSSGKLSPEGWAKAAKLEYARWKADAIVVERNFGGDMVTTVLRGAGFDGRIIEARATAGKKVRAEPIVGLYEQGKVKHLELADLAELEEEQVTWIPGKGPSPNRVDALVWACTELTKKRGSTTLALPSGRIGPPKSHAPGSRYARKNWNR